MYLQIYRYWYTIQKSMKTTSHILPFLIILTLFFTNAVAMAQGQQDEEFAEFAQNLANFFPSQSFEFELAATEQQTLIFWPNPDTQFVRGLFYITSTENGGLFVGCESSGEMKKTFYNKKIGVFNVPYPGTGDMKIILKSEIHLISVYISYEFVLKKKVVKSQAGTNRTQEELNQLAPIREKFEKVQKSIFGQAAILEGIVKSEMADERKIKDEVDSKAIKVIIETLVVIVSGVVSLYMLQKELKNGYELII